MNDYLIYYMNDSMSKKHFATLPVSFSVWKRKNFKDF